jgi:hypothetical protein
MAEEDKECGAGSVLLKTYKDMAIFLLKDGVLCVEKREKDGLQNGCGTVTPSRSQGQTSRSQPDSSPDRHHPLFSVIPFHPFSWLP